MSEYNVIGHSPLRKDAIEKATGRAIYTPDVKPDGMLYGRMLGSTVAHGIIKRIDTSKAEALPGVKAVVTGKDAPEARTGYIKDRHVLCKHKVRYLGDPVAAVAAITPEIAQQALELIEVEYEELPVILDVKEAFAKDCPVVLHEDLEHYETTPVPLLIYRLDPEHKNAFIHRQIRHGDIGTGFEEADVVIEGDYEVPRAHHCPMETHSCCVAPDVNGNLTIWASEQGGVRLKYFICNTFGLDSSKVRFITPYLGGGFGGKVDLMNTPICVMLAMKSGRPVRLEMSREECFIHGNPRSPATIHIKDGFKKDGTLVAREILEIINGGAYSGHVTVLCNDGAFGATGTYRCPNFKLDAYGVFTNTPATGPYRALGAEILCFAIECQMDRVANILGIDKVDIRRKNLLVNGDIDANGQVTKNNESLAALEEAAKAIEWGKPATKMEYPWVTAKGVAMGNKYTMSGSTSSMIVKICDDGVIEVRHYQIEMGQGCNTVLAQIAAESFGVSYDKVKIIFDDSQFCPFDHGTFCSRGTFMNGNALIRACEAAKKELFQRASQVMGIPADAIGTTNGTVYELANPENSLPFKALFNNGGWVPELGEIMGKVAFTYQEGTMDKETGQGEPTAYYSYGALGMEVAVNVETGDIRVLKALGYYDAGQVLNQKAIDGQMDGAFVMGIGQAIFEETMFNTQGKIINGNYRDYKIPTMLDVPYNKDMFGGFVGKPNPEGPYGAKGIGEVALVPAMPAIANAITAAMGVELNQLPMSKERVMWAIREHQNQSK